MELWKLITWLEGQDQSMHVRNGFGMPSSYRGYYEDVAFEPADETTIGQMLEYARSALGATFDGYKGGRYRMDEFTTCWIAPYGQTVDAPITEATLEMMLVSSEIAQLRADLRASHAAQVLIDLAGDDAFRDAWKANAEAVNEVVRLRADLARVTAERDEAIEDRRQARDDAARAAALLAVRTMERDARPAISREDAARVASWMDAAIFDGIDESTDPPAWAYNARDALRALAAGSGKGGTDA